MVLGENLLVQHAFHMQVIGIFNIVCRGDPGPHGTERIGAL